MAIDYQTREWKDDQTGGTPIDAANLNRMEQGIANACAGVDEIKGPGGVSADMIADGSISESKLSEDLRDLFWSSVVLTGNSTRSSRTTYRTRFWSSVVLTGNSTTNASERRGRLFWSSVILTQGRVGRVVAVKAAQNILGYQTKYAILTQCQTIR